MRLLLTACIIFILSSFNAASQVFKKLNYQAEGGIAISVGANTFGDIESTINPLTTQHHKHKRFRVPTMRIRGFVYKTLNDRFNLGLKTGIDVHYLERNWYGEYETNVSVPVQLFSEIRMIRIKKNRSVFAGAGFGWNLKNLVHEPFAERSGILASFEISCNNNLERKSFYYKIGFEYCEENSSYHFIPDQSWEKEEFLKYKQHRKQLYIAAGINL